MAKLISSESIPPVVPALILALLAIFISITATRWGIGVWNDSVAYLNLRVDPGLAPLLRWVHALLGGLGVDIAVASRWLFVFLLTANVVLVYYSLNWVTHSLGTSFLGTVLVFAPVPILRFHLMVYSEPLYFLLGLIGLLFLSRHLETKKLGFLVFSAVAIALAFLDRFVGIALVVAGGLSILLWSGKNFSKRIVDSAIFAIISIAPMAIYLIYRAVVYEAATDREFKITNTASFETLVRIVGVLARFLQGEIALPRLIRMSVVAAAALLLILLAVVYIRQWSRNRETGVASDAFDTLPLVLAVYVPWFLIVWFVGVIAEANREVGGPVVVHLRHILPLYFSGALLIVLLVNKVLKPWQKFRFVYIVIVALAVGLAFNISFGAKSYLQTASKEGLGYVSKIWRESELMEHVNGLDPAMRVYTNGIAPVLFYNRNNHRKVQEIPFTYNPRTGNPNSSYGQELEIIQRDLNNGEAVLVMFSHPRSIGMGAWFPTEEELQAQLSLDVFWKNPEGAIYTSRK